MEAIIQKPEDFEKFLREISAQIGFAGIASVPLQEPRLLESLSSVRERLLSDDAESWPAYLRESAGLRFSPPEAFPWANSLLIASIPFESLPPIAGSSLRITDDLALSGLIAGYAAREDYHTHGARLMRELAENLRAFIKTDFRFEACADSQPIAERPVAFWAGLGIQGRNACLLSPSGKSCFLAELVLEIPLPLIRANDSLFKTPCDKCSICVESCPSGALADGFKCRQCIAALCSEKRGALTRKERERLGEWVFGCGLCTSKCPAMRMPKPVRIDLEWLLLCPSSELKTVLQSSTMKHPGPTILRRNALAVLGNKHSDEALKLIERFLAKTQSPLLRDTAKAILEGN